MQTRKNAFVEWSPVSSKYFIYGSNDIKLAEVLHRNFKDIVEEDYDNDTTHDDNTSNSSRKNNNANPNDISNNNNDNKMNINDDNSSSINNNANINNNKKIKANTTNINKNITNNSKTSLINKNNAGVASNKVNSVNSNTNSRVNNINNSKKNSLISGTTKQQQQLVGIDISLSSSIDVNVSTSKINSESTPSSASLLTRGGGNSSKGHMITYNTRSFKILKSTDVAQSLTCLQWFPDPSKQNPFLIAAGSSTGKLSLIDFSKTNTIVKEIPQRNTRSCNTVAWNPRFTQQIAVGLEKSRSDYGMLIYDIKGFSSSMTNNSRSNNPYVLMHKLAYGEGITSVAWKRDQPQTVVIGTGSKYLRIYDLRGNTTSQVSVAAHSKAVHGLVFDSLRPDLLATFSDGPSETVKVWDIRYIDNSNPTPIVSIGVGETGGNVTQVVWSPLKSGVLAITKENDPKISLWDINRAENNVLNQPFHSRTASAPIISMAWQHLSRDANSRDTANMNLVPNRLLAATRNGIEMITIHVHKPLSVSKHGNVLFGAGKILFHGNLNTTEQHLSHNNNFTMDLSILENYQERTKQGYSFDVGGSLQVISDQMDAVSALTNSSDASYILEELQHLWMLWTWIERVETLCETDSYITMSEFVASSDWPVTSLIDAGVNRLMESDGDGNIGIEQAINCQVYDSPGRRLALKACGWSVENEEGAIDGEGRPGLRRIMEECEANCYFERSAALAVFHGDLRAAVGALQRGADYFKQKAADLEEIDLPTNTNVDVNDITYAELLSLVAMCIAGYVSPITRVVGKKKASNMVTSSSSRTLWREMCENLLARPQMQQRNNASYLRAACSFLVSIAEFPPSSAKNSPKSTNSYTKVFFDKNILFQRVLEDTAISLADRTAIACSFLPYEQVQNFLHQQSDECIVTGNLEGMLLFGLGKQGFELLQAYLDRTADVQTVALVSSRILLPQDWVEEERLSREWLDTYRDLLNCWQMWHARALFDVGRAQLLKEYSKRQETANALNSNLTLDTEQNQKSSALINQERKLSVVNQINKPQPQLYLRCNYCNASVSMNSLKRQGKTGNSWLSRQKPILNCCSECRKPFPRCYICLMTLGSLNPYLEFKRRLKRNQQISGYSPNNPRPANHLDDDDEMSDISSIEFNEWFTWCQFCKHGGHSHHIAAWFESHNECGVSGCQCRCYELDLSTLRNI